jgi:tetratricopeptide (TPR) repeat protein
VLRTISAIRALVLCAPLIVSLNSCATVPVGLDSAVDPTAHAPLVPAPGHVYDPASGVTPLVLLGGSENGVDYHTRRYRAEMLLRQREYAQAEPMLEQLVREYARDPETWYMLATLKMAVEKPLEAIPAWENVARLAGSDLEFAAAYRIAESHLAAGNRRAALDVLRHHIFEAHGFWRQSLYDWPGFSALREDPEFLDIIGRPDTGDWDRVRGWTYDLDFLVSELTRVNPDYRHLPLPPEFTRRYERLKADIPTLSDEEIFYEMNRMLAVLRQGHLGLFIFPGNRYLPLRFYAFPEGIFIIDAADEHRQLIGARVETVGSLPADEALRRLALSASVESEMSYLWVADHLARTAYLKGMGAITSTESVDLHVQRPGEPAHTVTVRTSAERPAERQDRLAPPPAVTPPLFLSRMDRTFWEHPLPEHDAFYIQVNNIRNETDETLVRFGWRLHGVLSESGARNLILDLRHNNGGTTQRYPQLLRTVIAFSRMADHQVYVLIGRRTYSAAGNLITDLERLANPIFVGEASSECCNLYGDPTSVTLPYSGILGELTAYKWQLSTPGDRRREMSPDVPVQLTAADYFAGRDPVLAAVKELIAAGATGLPRYW